MISTVIDASLPFCPTFKNIFNPFKNIKSIRNHCLMNLIQFFCLQYIAIVDLGMATVAWSPLPKSRLPADCQDSATGSQDRIEVR